MTLDKLLFTKKQLRDITLKNRVAIAPMCNYSAKDGFANDWHLVHLGKFAQGGAGLVFTEATAVQSTGRITHGDLGIWKDDHIPGLKKISEFIKSQNSIPGIQLAHAGRKASMQRPWHGNGPLDHTDQSRGEDNWEIDAPSAIAVAEGFLTPHELSLEEIGQIQNSWKDATIRARKAGFEVVELHSAHGYLGHEFLSPISNKRKDKYGNTLEGRMRFVLETAEIIRENWPKNKPVFTRISSVDGVDGGWTLEDSVTLSKELKKRGIDVIDCSSGGISGSATAAKIKRGPGFQVPFSEKIKIQADISTMTVGLITEPHHAEEILQSGKADIIAIGREALYNPNWALHSEVELMGEGEFESWPHQYGWWLDKRQKSKS